MGVIQNVPGRTRSGINSLVNGETVVGEGNGGVLCDRRYLDGNQEIYTLREKIEVQTGVGVCDV